MTYYVISLCKNKNSHTGQIKKKTKHLEYAKEFASVLKENGNGRYIIKIYNSRWEEV